MVKLKDRLRECTRNKNVNVQQCVQLSNDRYVEIIWTAGKGILNTYIQKNNNGKISLSNCDFMPYNTVKTEYYYAPHPHKFAFH